MTPTKPNNNSFFGWRLCSNLVCNCFLLQVISVPSKVSNHRAHFMCMKQSLAKFIGNLRLCHSIWWCWVQHLFAIGKLCQSSYEAVHQCTDDQCDHYRRWPQLSSHHMCHLIQCNNYTSKHQTANGLQWNSNIIKIFLEKIKENSIYFSNQWSNLVTQKQMLQ